MQLWMPAILALFGSLMVVVVTAWLNTKVLSSQMDALRAEMKQGLAEFRLETRVEIAASRTDLRDEVAAFRIETRDEIAAFRLDVHDQFSDVRHRLERLEGQRGLVRP